MKDDDIKEVVNNYMEDLFLPQNKILITPKQYSNAIYIVLMGKVILLKNNKLS